MAAADSVLSEGEFAALMQRLGPFGVRPSLAVAVSGGADSLALALLLQDWVAAREGSLTALTVDHGLRPEAAREARWVGRTLRRRGLRHKVLTWDGPKPRSGLQAAARLARYRLLTDWCAKNGVLFLVLAHHQDDQAETLLLRLGSGSGLDGLAAMSAIGETAEARLLRPFLTVPKARLEATLRVYGLDWIEDPSNRDPRHARVRLRQAMPSLAAEGLTAPRLAAAADHLGRVRADLERQVGRLLAQAASLHPAGFARLDPAALVAAPEEIGRRALARLLMCVGGTDYAPRLERLERLYFRLAQGQRKPATLGGCRILPLSTGVLVVRETRGPETRKLEPTDTAGKLHWDGRFRVELAEKGRNLPRSACIAPLSREGWRVLLAAAPELRGHAVPAAARGALPAFSDAEGLAAVPHLSYWRGPEARKWLKKCRFAPKNPLTPPGFTVAYRARHIIS